jgi:hypothetical protein
MIFRVAPPKRALPLRGLENFFAYVERYDIVPQATSLVRNASRGAVPDPVSGMYLLKPSHRANGSCFGDIVPVSQLRGPVKLTPFFGAEADHRLTRYNSFDYSSEFWLNKYSDKEVFWALSQ